MDIVTSCIPWTTYSKCGGIAAAGGRRASEDMPWIMFMCRVRARRSSSPAGERLRVSRLSMEEKMLWGSGGDVDGAGNVEVVWVVANERRMEKGMRRWRSLQPAILVI